jgi:hypothetical protein
MKNYSTSALWATAAWLVAGVFSAPAFAQGGEEASLTRGAAPDTTAQQRYQSAIREAGGGLKVSLEECKIMPQGMERKRCDTDARSRYQRDMADARAMRRNPGLGPVNVTGDPIRSTETVIPVKP